MLTDGGKYTGWPIYFSHRNFLLTQRCITSDPTIFHAATYVRSIDRDYKVAAKIVRQDPIGQNIQFHAVVAAYTRPGINYKLMQLDNSAPLKIMVAATGRLAIKNIVAREKRINVGGVRKPNLCPAIFAPDPRFSTPATN